jgi:hypothetical protein
VQLAGYCRAIAVDAVWQRFRKAELQHWLRGPSFVLTCSAAILLLMAAATHGFRITRGLVAMARELLGARVLPSGRSEDALVAYGVPIVFALATGIVLVAIGRMSLRSGGWRYGSYLVLKMMAVMLIVPLLWIEGGAAIRARIPNPDLRVILGGALLALLFIAAFGCALLWTVADQRRRCPVCLQRLAMPVTIGSWASMFDPVTTELLCNEGHGSLCISEGELGDGDHWTAFGSSWSSLFHTADDGEPVSRDKSA